MRAPSGCLLDDGERRDGVSLAVGSSCGVPADDKPLWRVNYPGAHLAVPIGSKEGPLSGPQRWMKVGSPGN